MPVLGFDRLVTGVFSYFKIFVGNFCGVFYDTDLKNVQWNMKIGGFGFWRLD